MKNRLFFILWITIMAILWLAGNLRSAGIILADSLLAAVILSVQAAVSAKGLRVDYRLKGSYNGENQASLQINTNYNGLLPVKLYLRMQTENQLTGEKQTMQTDGILPGRGVGNKSLTVELEDTHAGKLQVQIEQIAVTDLFGLLRFRLGGVNMMGDKKIIELQDLPNYFLQRAETTKQANRTVEERIGEIKEEKLSFSEYMTRIETDLINKAMSTHRGNITKAAESLGMSRQGLQHRIKKIEGK